MSSPTVTVMIAVPSPTAVTRPFSSTVAMESSLELKLIPTNTVSGFLVALIVYVSSTYKSNVSFSTVTLASFKLTLTVIVLFSAAAYLSSPAKLTVIVV